MVDRDNQSTVANGFWPKLAANFARLPFAEEAIAAYYCAFDAATPLKVKGTLLAALAYFVMPFDVIPDFLLGLGFTDDLAVLVTAISMVRSHITDAHRKKAAETVDRLKQGEAVNG
jgi:uncharacterized membrane protein YkvA (DUF1232 family)